jgi:hypothetical protein
LSCLAISCPFQLPGREVLVRYFCPKHILHQ